jgi:hypothetical protein
MHANRSVRGPACRRMPHGQTCTAPHNEQPGPPTHPSQATHTPAAAPTSAVRPHTAGPPALMRATVPTAPSGAATKAAQLARVVDVVGAGAGLGDVDGTAAGEGLGDAAAGEGDWAAAGCSISATPSASKPANVTARPRLICPPRRLARDSRAAESARARARALTRCECVQGVCSSSRLGQKNKLVSQTLKAQFDFLDGTSQ